MAKLKEGERVAQKFDVTMKFKAVDGDTKYKASDVKAYLLDAAAVEYGPDHGVSVVVKEIKELAS
jgi:hypothetical protein